MYPQAARRERWTARARAATSVPMADWSALYDSAGPAGVLHVRAGLGLGVTERMLRRRAVEEAWPLHYPLVVGLPGTSLRDPLTRMAAALISVGYPSFAAKESALWLHGVLPDRDAPRRPQLLLPHDRRHRPRNRRDLEVIRSRILPVTHVTDVRDLRATTIARSLVDLAEAGASRARLRGLAIRARRLGAVDIAAELAECCGTFAGGRAGLRVIALVIADLLGDGADSSPEFRWRRILRDHGIGAWPAPFPWLCDDRVIVHLDVAVPDSWVSLEHEGPDHRRPEVFRTDRVRWSQIGRAWSVVWATEEDLAAPGRVLAELRHRIAAADPERPPARPATCGCGVCRRSARAAGQRRQPPGG